MAKKVVKNLKSSSKGRHWGITVLSVLGYIGAVCTLLMGIFMILGSAAVGPVIAKWAVDYAWLSNAGAAMMIFLGIVFVGLAIFDYYIARGFWKGQNWARIAFLILTGLSALSALFSLQIVSLLFNALLIWYVGFYKPAVSWFK